MRVETFAGCTSDSEALLMAVVFIPPQMRELVGGCESIEVPGRTLRQVVAALEERHPGMAQRLQNGDRLASGLAVSIDGTISSRGMLAQVNEDSEIHFHPALGGG